MMDTKLHNKVPWLIAYMLWSRSSLALDSSVMYVYQDGQAYVRNGMTFV